MIKRSGNKGFTLLEILITVAIISFGIVGATQAFNTGFAISADAEETARAREIARAKLEEIKNTIFKNIASSGPTSDADFPAFTTTVTVTQAPSAPGGSLLQIVVTVRGRRTSVTLTTLVANRWEV